MPFRDGQISGLIKFCGSIKQDLNLANAIKTMSELHTDYWGNTFGSFADLIICFPVKD